MKIGDKINGGIIFYIESNGIHGLMAAENDIGSSENFDFGSEQIELLTSLVIGKGQENTSLILKKYKVPKAGNLCVDYNFNGFTDWYLPSKEELHLMYIELHRKGIGGFSDSGYWSSSQSGTTDDFGVYEIWWLDFSNGKEYIGIYEKKKIRAIRSF